MRALLPVGQTGEMGNRIEYAERHHPRACRCIGADDEAAKSAVLFGKARTQQGRAQVAGGAHLQCDLAFGNDALEVRIGHGGRTAVDVKRDVGPHGQEMIPVIAADPGMEAPPVWHVVTRPAPLAAATSGT
jgi:hypothetical protein